MLSWCCASCSLRFPRKIHRNSIENLFPGTRDLFELPKDSTLMWVQDDDSLMDESKYLLFEKYMKDQIGVEDFRDFQSDFNLHFNNQSNDTISTTYPISNSLRNDITSSSVASSFAISQIESPDSMKMTGDQFEIPERSDELDIQQKYSDFLNRISRNRMSSNTRNVPRYSELSNISDSSMSTVISCARVSSKSEKDFIINRTRPSEYSKEYLSLAQNFGAVVTMRRPGHHTGPVRNPDCECEHCRAWNEDRQAKNKGKLLLFEETPITQTAFWKKNHRHYV